MVTDRPLLALRLALPLTLMHRPRPPTTVYYSIRTFGDGLINNGWRSLDAGARKPVQQAGSKHVNNSGVPSDWLDVSFLTRSCTHWDLSRNITYFEAQTCSDSVVLLSLAEKPVFSVHVSPFICFLLLSHSRRLWWGNTCSGRRDRKTITATMGSIKKIYLCSRRRRRSKLYCLFFSKKKKKKNFDRFTKLKNTPKHIHTPQKMM